jgi:flagellar basal-body rod modification protein FlgD
MTSAISTVQPTQTPSATGASTTQLNQDFDSFLRLLTTQLKNQDPLEPTDTTEFTNQLVNFSQVEQQIRSNSNLEKMIALNALNVTSLGLGFIGLEVDSFGDKASFNGTNAIRFGYQLPENTVSSNIKILNKDGATVYDASGESAAGKFFLNWNGKDNAGNILPPGDYTIKVTATDNAGKQTAAVTTAPALVTGIESDGQNSVLLNIGDRKIPITNVTNARKPESLL